MSFEFFFGLRNFHQIMQLVPSYVLELFEILIQKMLNILFWNLNFVDSHKVLPKSDKITQLHF